MCNKLIENPGKILGWEDWRIEDFKDEKFVEECLEDIRVGVKNVDEKYMKERVLPAVKEKIELKCKELEKAQSAAKQKE